MKMLSKYLIISLVFYLGFFVFSKNSSYQTIKEPYYVQDSVLSIIFAGDIMQHKPQIDAAWDDSLQTYHYDSCFKFVAPILMDNDLAMANFEFTLGGKPYEGYPQFSAPDQIVNALLYAGFDLVSTANNHSCDRGKQGIERTIHVLDSMGLKHLGTYVDSASRANSYPLIIRKNGIKLALLNYTYGTNGISVPAPNIVNLISEEQIKTDLKRAKDSLPDKTIVFIHWGDEYISNPNQYQEYYAKLCFDNGADIIIGMHPHVIQKIERMNYPDSNGREVFIAYSLGNYISNQRTRYRDGGMMVKIDLVKRNNKVSIADCGYYLNWVYTPRENGKTKFYILPVSQFENRTGVPDTASFQKMMLYVNDSRSLMKNKSKNIKEYVYDINTRVWKQSEK
ncbi:MAG TPA: CapA family protein [Bacteroidales bacterium]|nr:CapA family protein [Bacteroidales bacterium]